MKTDHLQINYYNSFEDIGESAWNELLAGSPTNTIFLTYQWQTVWWKTFAKNEELLIVVARKDGRLAGIAPFMIQTRKGTRRATFICAQRADYLDFLYPADEIDVLEALISALFARQRLFSRIEISNIPQQSPTCAHLARICRSYKQRLLHWIEGPSFIAQEDGNGYFQTIVKKKETARLKRMLEKQRNCRCEHIADPEVIAPLLDPFFNQHISRWADAHGQSLFLRRQNMQFYRSLLTELGKKKWILFSQLLHGDNPLAYHFGFCYNGILTYYKPSYDVAYKQFSPGSILLGELFRLSHENGLRGVDLGMGGEPYKQRYSNTQQIQHSYFIPGSLPSFLALALQVWSENDPRYRKAYEFIRSLRPRKAAKIAPPPAVRDEWPRIPRLISNVKISKKQPPPLAEGPLKKGVYIFYYHSIVDAGKASEWERAYRDVATDSIRFSEQIRWLCSVAEPIALSRVPEFLQSSPDEKARFVITFDDGYTNILTSALPLLKGCGIVPAMFVNSDFVSGISVYYRVLLALMLARGQEKLLRKSYHHHMKTAIPWGRNISRHIKRTYEYGVTEKLVMDAWHEKNGDSLPADIHCNLEDIKKLTTLGWECGNHSASHATLSALSFEQQSEELNRNIRYFAQHKVPTIPWISFPNGGCHHVNNDTQRWFTDNPTWNGMFGNGGFNKSASKTEWLRIGVANPPTSQFRDMVAEAQFRTEAVGGVTTG